MGLFYKFNDLYHAFVSCDLNYVDIYTLFDISDGRFEFTHARVMLPKHVSGFAYPSTREDLLNLMKRATLGHSEVSTLHKFSAGNATDWKSWTRDDIAVLHDLRNVSRKRGWRRKKAMQKHDCGMFVLP